MVRSNATTSPGLIGPANHQGGLRAGDEIGQNRRALSAINQNIIAHPPCHCTVKKRGGLSKENVECSTKNPHIQIHRPITRKFAAELADKQQIIGKSEDPEIIDLEDDEASNEGPVPMFVQHTQAMLEEIDQQMEEVEMEDLEEEEEELIDIDSSDGKDPLAVVAYINDIYAYYRKSEQSLNTVPSNYMARQGDINERMRGILIDWLIEVHYKFELMEETLYLTVNLVDRFLAANPVVRKHLQLVGITAMLLACKYEEVSVPVVEDLIMISDKAYTRKEMLEMERVMVNTLQFNLSIPTPYVFMRRFLKAAQSDRELELVSFFMIELSLVDYKMLKFPPSLLAAAAVFTAQCTVRGLRQWSRTIERHSGYPAEELVECSKMMVVSHQKAGTGKLTGVHRKYNTAKFGYAARCEPAIFLLED